MMSSDAWLRWLVFAPLPHVSKNEMRVLTKRSRRSKAGPAVAQPGGPDGICPLRDTK